ncbi:histidine kinase [Aphanothece hegewaldii CCALA 016]|uniref:histidine kinase n=1 Tax=Aphanothece hegewaldii CCALA 016 TaxID=2107694 RepID=A0A2T1M2B2_9CHRO|nr:ATP-binding protein [Aphanothece hegewaldii]PSF38898.1 histidine kinase [Aphanothece hegewaldii CCALA 016]
MNLPSSAKSILYQLTQEFNPPSQSLTISNTTFRNVTKALFNFLIEQQILATVWYKFPHFEELEQYYQQGKATQIYYCTTRLKKLEDFAAAFEFKSNTHHCTSITPLVLEPSSQLKKEYYFIVLSPQFCCLLLAHKQTEPSLNNTNEHKQPISWTFISSFEPVLINNILTVIKQSIIVTDQTPEEVLSSNHSLFTLPNNLNSKLINSLLMQQIKQSEMMQNEEKIIKDSSQKIKYITDEVQFKTSLLKNLSQEISLPLTNMKTALLLLNSKQAKKEQRQRYLDLLQRECDRQSLVVTGLLELVAFEQLTGELGTTLKLEDLIPGIVSTYQPLAEEKGISMGYTVPRKLPVVSCPESWLRQILQNILNNSLKYTPSGGRIFVRAFFKSNCVEITITDTGIGIDSGEINKIFNSFYRGKNNDANSSAGLGLTIVKYLLSRCGGDILVSSKLEQGTTFTVILPIVHSKLEED